MPKGAKKRKAAKKKKENEAHSGRSSPNNNPQGNDDAKSGEVSPTSIRSVGADKPMKGVPSDAETVQKVELKRELKEDSESKNLIIEHTESSKESYNGDDRSSSSSSSSSSSDDESRVVERIRKEKAYASVSEEKPLNDSVRPVDSLPAEVIQTTGDAPAGKITSSSAEKAPLVDSVKPVVSVSDEAIHLTESTLVESSAISDNEVKTGLENGAKKLLPTGAPVTLTDSISKKIEDRASPLLNGNAKASSSVVESVSKGNESKVLPPLGASPAQISNDAESIKDSEIPEYSENQPLVAPPPRVVQKTSWCSCCGILDVITGSSR